MSTIRNFVIVTSDEWFGLYENGILGWEGESMNVLLLARSLKGNACRITEYRQADQDWIDEVGTLPCRLEDCRTVGGVVW